MGAADRAPELLETLLWEPGSGLFLLGAHLARIGRSAAALGYRFDEAAVRAAIEAAGATLTAATRLRLLTARDGGLRVEAAPLEPLPHPLRLRIADEPVDSREPLLLHKTADRSLYTRRLAAHPGFADVLLLNERGEVTESTIANVVVREGDVLWTPPVSAGLLPGVFRAELLASGRIRERTLRPEELRGADAVYLVNSVRRWMAAELVW